jgi:hypothetical protein
VWGKEKYNMASPELDPVVSYAPLVPGAVSIDSKTITAWLQVAFAAGFYTVGGVPAGLQAYLGTLTVNTTEPLWIDMKSEEPVTSSLNIGGYTYRYNPLNDSIQIFDGAASPSNELTASQAIPVGVLNDVIICRATYNRLSA